LTGEVQPQIYICQWVAGRPFAISLRTVMRDPLSLSSALQQAVAAAEPGAAIDHVQTMEQMMEQERSSDRAEMILFGAFAAVALLLASVGIFGVMSFAVEQRTHEIGVRMALGARRSEVVRLVLSSGMRMATVGLCIGLAGALGLGRIMHSTLYGVKSVDALSLIAVAGLLMVLALVACWVPARRSAAVDPMRALRNE
ncbi:MAG: FtsX-like permease family protein, partial [Terracidiphilus sp.]